MKAVRLYAKGDLRVDEVERAGDVPEGWVRLQVTMAGICGSDIHNYKTGQWISRSPSTAGHEFTGVVTELGADVCNFQIGDTVVADSRFWCGTCDRCISGEHHLCRTLGFVGEVCDGGFAQETVLPERLLYAVPRDVPPRLAAMSEPLAVALHAVRRLNLTHGEPLLVVGCGPIGGLAAMVAAHLGFGPIQVMDANSDRAALVAQVTGSEVVRELDRGHRAVIDATGSIAALRMLLAKAASGTRIALVGISHGTFDFDPNILVEREISLIGCHAFQHEMPDAISMLSVCAPQLHGFVDSEITLDEVPEAYLRIIAGQATKLKTLIRTD